MATEVPITRIHANACAPTTPAVRSMVQDLWGFLPVRGVPGAERHLCDGENVQSERAEHPMTI